MRFVECVDYGDAPTILISEPALISLIDDNVHEIHCVKVQTPDGLIERRVACRLIVPWRLWLAAADRYREARVAIIKEAQDLGSRVGLH